MDLKTDLQGIDALEGDGLDAGNGHATGLIDWYLSALWKLQAGNRPAWRKSAVNAWQFVFGGRSENGSIAHSATRFFMV